MVFLLDPLIATGGTAKAALHMIIEWGVPVNKIKLLCVLASKPGLEHVRAEFPELEIWAAAVDPELNDKGYILPGLGDTVRLERKRVPRSSVVMTALPAGRPPVQYTSKRLKAAYKTGWPQPVQLT